jgi:hypothetical protein
VKPHGWTKAVYAALATALVASVSSVVFGEDVLTSLTYSPSDLAFAKSGGFDTVTLRGANLQVVTGEPVIPVRYVRLAIPIGYEAIGASVNVRSEVVLPGQYKLVPGTDPAPLSYTGPAPKPVEGPVYRTPGQYPAEPCRLIGTGHKSGYPIADVAVYPVRYGASSGQITLVEQMDVIVEIAPEAVPSAAISPRPETSENIFRDAVCGLVDNPEAVPETASGIGPSVCDAGDVTYLIITSSSLVSAFQPLADWKTKKGVPTEIVTTTWVYSNYSGELAGDNQDKIRQCIKDYWQNHGTVYVLLGGDVGVVPYRPAYTMSGDYGNALPADLYYSDLDGTWNGDGDSNYGEYPADGIDMYSDVYVGRAPVQSTSETNIFVNKVLQYEAESSQPALPTDYELKMLMLASKADSSTDTAILMDIIDSESVPAQWTITKLYQSLGNLSRTSAINALNTGMNVVAHAGHGNTTNIQAGSSYITGSDMYGLTNGPRYTGIMYSLSCFSGDYPSNDCLAEYFDRAPNGGGPYIGNSRYGWYYSGMPATGVSAQYERWFFRALTGSGNCYNLGQAHGVGKDYGVSTAKSDAYERYCHYELNLFGDAETPIWKDTPAVLDVSHGAEFTIGDPSYTVTVTDYGSAISSARVCLLKGTEVYEIGTTNVSGQVTFYPSPVTTGTMYVTVTKNDYLPYEGTADVVEENDSVSGNVTLELMAGSLAGRVMTIEFRNPGTQTVVQSYAATLNSAGDYAVSSVISGTYDLALKYENWLRQVLPSQVVNGATVADFTLHNGDVDHNNTVDLVDMNSVLTAFGTSGGQADLDCNGTVDLNDLNITFTNFDLSGDP